MDMKFVYTLINEIVNTFSSSLHIMLFSNFEYIQEKKSKN